MGSGGAGNFVSFILGLTLGLAGMGIYMQTRKMKQARNEWPSELGTEAIPALAQEKFAHQDVILTLIQDKGRISSAEVSQLLDISPAKATLYLQELVKAGKVRRRTEQSGALTYSLKHKRQK